MITIKEGLDSSPAPRPQAGDTHSSSDTIPRDSAPCTEQRALPAHHPCALGHLSLESHGFYHGSTCFSSRDHLKSLEHSHTDSYSGCLSVQILKMSSHTCAESPGIPSTQQKRELRWKCHPHNPLSGKGKRSGRKAAVSVSPSTAASTG